MLTFKSEERVAIIPHKIERGEFLDLKGSNLILNSASLIIFLYNSSVIRSIIITWIIKFI